MSSAAVAKIENVTKTYRAGRRIVSAVSGVSMEIQEGRRIALVGESGSGKSTLAKLILRLTEIDSGRVLLDNKDIYRLPPKELNKLRPKYQYVFQNPYSSLNPKMTVLELLAEGVLEHGICKKGEVMEYSAEMLLKCGLSGEYLYRFPYQLSGGQRQKVALARALALKPRLLVCDEITSALDYKSKEKILSLIVGLNREHKFSVLFITHDLDAAEAVAQDIAVMHSGKIVEKGDAKRVLNSPSDEYSRILVQSWRENR